MKVFLPVLVLSAILCISFYGNKKPLHTQPKGFTVIELFTSEGCSSCPPADKLSEEINKEYADKNVLVLAYHVDYWNRLGWKDRFSHAGNTERQNHYAQIFNLNTIYTPQVVVNGTSEFVGSSESKMLAAINASTKVNTPVMLTASPADNNKILVNYEVPNKTSDENMLIILVQKEADTDIKRGENEGRKLHHINIVRWFEKTNKTKGSLELKLPDEKTNQDYFVVALLQNERTGSINGYSKSTIK